MNILPDQLVPPLPSPIVARRLAVVQARVSRAWRAIGQKSSSEGCPNDHCRWLSSLWPFRELPQTLLSALARHARVRDFAAGEKLIRQGARSRRLLAVINGSVEVSVQHDGRRHVVVHQQEGAILGEMGLLTGARCTATATAITPVRTLVIPARRVHRLIMHFPVLGSSLGHLIASRLGRASTDSLAGKVLRGYRVRRCVGRGGMGVVYEAQRCRDGRRVALKMLSHRFASDFDMQRRFDREIRICRSLRHPNIGRVLGHFSAFGTRFIVMEFCDGVTLDALIRRSGPLPEDQVRRITGQLAAALAYVHHQGICHRDVKPGNIMVAQHGQQVRLMDFGLAKSASCGDLTANGCLLGTPRYMAPEQLAGERADYRSDLFALGCVVYEMLTVQVLFDTGDVFDNLVRPRGWSLPASEQIRPGLSDDLYRFLQQTIAANPQDRVVDLEQIARLWTKTGHGPAGFRSQAAAAQ
jgi:CRP-like cAMP-binding protein